MKKPIDPNLDEFDSSLPIDVNDSNEDFKINDDNINNVTNKSTVKSGEIAGLEESSFKGVTQHQSHHSSKGNSEHGSSHHHSSGSHSEHGSSRHHSSSSHGSSRRHSSGSHRHHSHSSSKKKKKLPLIARIFISIVAIILAVAVAAAGTFFVLEQKGKKSLTNSSTVTTQENYEETISYNGHEYVYNKDIVAIAFLGVDKRELGLDDGVVGTAGQADANIVVTINTKTGEAKAIAIPRDTMVDVDLYSDKGVFLRNEKKQLCLAYAYGNGTDTSAENVTTSISRILYNVPINKYFALDLNGIAPINDAIGGVTVTSLYDFKNVDIKKGDTVHLTGDLTETYVRTRDMDNIEASLNRTARQVQYIKAFAAQLAPAIMKDFSIVSKLYNTATEYSTTNITLSDATYLASLLVSKGINDFETVTIEGEMKKSENVENADVVFAEFYPDEDKLMELVLDTFYTQIK